MGINELLIIGIFIMGLMSHLPICVIRQLTGIQTNISSGLKVFGVIFLNTCLIFTLVYLLHSFWLIPIMIADLFAFVCIVMSIK
jgi:hypothetical protein